MKPNQHSAAGAVPEERCVPRVPSSPNWHARATDLECTLSEVDRFVRVAEMALREDGNGLDVSEREAVRFVLAEAMAVIDRTLLRAPR